jgi:SAM-dependent methyltransferase
MKQAIHRVNARLGLARPLERARLRLLARRLEAGNGVADDGYPIPPPVLLVGITSEVSSAEWYLESGRGDIEAIAQLLGRHGVAASELEAVLDFGCGCGRVARRWLRYPDVGVSGSDYDPKMVAWCTENLPFIEARKNNLEPPLAYDRDRFDFAYAFSVFTHLDAEGQHAWLREMHRVLKPDTGLLLFSAFGPSHARNVLTGSDAERFERGELVVKRPEVSGEGVCIAVHPPRWVDRVLPELGFEIVDRFDETRRFRGTHDFYLARALG